MRWLAWALLTAVFWGVGPIFAKLGLGKADPLLGLSIRTFGVAFALLVISLATGNLGSLTKVPLLTAAALLAEGVFASLLGHFAYFNALKTGPASTVAAVTASFPLVTLMVAAAVLGESVTVGRAIGAAMVVLGLVFLRLF
ncbi:MAG: EamA family transporter [Bacillota bacterium]